MEQVRIVTDVLVLGTGAAGCLAALEAAEHAADVVLVNKGALARTGNTNLATVTMAGALGQPGSGDSPEMHMVDTIKGGHYLGSQKLVQILCEEAPKEIYHLNRLGMPWDQSPDGSFDLRPMPGFSRPRGVYYDGKTGRTLQVVLARAVSKQPKITVIDDLHAFWITQSGDSEVTGAFGYEASRGRLVHISAKAVVLATGGAGRMYRTSTMEKASTGDGMAMAYRAGAQLIDMEFHQIFPTGFVWPESLEGILVASSVLWSKGLRLYNALGERFMERYDPVNLENCPRDMLTRAVYKEVTEGRGTPRSGVWLDTNHISDWESVKAEFAKVYVRPTALGVDTRRIEVAPTYHFTMGGVKFDAHGQTSLPRLFVAGEAGGGIHGANRLGGNALTECAVFGVRAGRAASRYCSKPRPETSKNSVDAAMEFLNKASGDGTGPSPHRLRARLNEIMSSYAWVSRTRSEMTKGLGFIRELREESRHVTVTRDEIYNPQLIEAIQLNHMLLLAELVFRSATMREETRGAHCREEFPVESKLWLSNIVVQESGGDVQTHLEPVEFPHVLPEDD